LKDFYTAVEMNAASKLRLLLVLFATFWTM